jgi:RNA polymerase sigma-70 factor (ECF subfamily)
MERTEECELVSRTLKGDLSAFERLYSRHQARIYSALFFRTRSKEDAEDLLQTTFLRAYLGLKGFRGESAFSTWLMQIAMNVCTTFHRAEQSRRIRQDTVEACDATLRTIWEPTSDPNPEDFTLLNERRSVVEAHIKDLPYPYRDVTELRYMKDRSYLEITKELNVPVGTVKTWLFRARKQLRERFEKSEATAM